jgi:hypothetical protein
MAKITGFAKAFAGRGAHRRNGHQATLANTAEFFNSLLAEPHEVRNRTKFHSMFTKKVRNQSARETISILRTWFCDTQFE